jgi:hypothetical protein
MSRRSKEAKQANSVLKIVCENKRRPILVQKIFALGSRNVPLRCLDFFIIKNSAETLLATALWNQPSRQQLRGQLTTGRLFARRCSGPSKTWIKNPKAPAATSNGCTDLGTPQPLG